MKSHVLMFLPRFHDPIRAVRKRPITPGDRLDLRAWSDKPYRSPQIMLGTAICVDTANVAILNRRGMLCVRFDHAGELNLVNRDAFARADGFKDADDMLMHWFEKHRLGLDRGVFYGQVIIWGNTFKPEVSP